MHLTQHLSLKQRIVLTGVLLAIAPMVALGVVFWRQFQAVSATAQSGSEKLAGSYLAQAGETAFSAATQAQTDISGALRVAQASLEGNGGLQTVRHRHTTWEVTNQETQETKKVSLPLVAIGRKLSRSSKNITRKPLVDDVQDLTGATCTVFQRMNPEGDMLRIATTVLKADGTRAVGTFIPAVSSTGKPNAVLAAVLAGKEFSGKAVVVGTPYLTVYAPIKASDGSVMGMLYTGIQEQIEANRLRDRLSSMHAADRGEVFALSATTPAAGQYLFSASRQAQNVPAGAIRNKWVETVLAHPDRPAVERYQSTKGVPMVAHLQYLASWKWLLGVAIPEQEYLETPRQIDTLAEHGRRWIGGVFFASLLLSVLVWARSASGLTTQLGAFVRATREDSSRLLAWAKKLATSSKDSSQGITEQLQAVERTSAQIQAAAKENEKRSEEALKASSESDQRAQTTHGQLTSMQESMHQLTSANGKISGLMKDIDDIAFQSRILALNARIEAARAGEAGVSFAVVADQFGSLAERCAQAAKTTTEFLTESSTSTREGMEKLTHLSTSIREMADNTGLIRTRIQDVHLAAGGQVRASAEIAQSLALINKVIGRNAQLAEQNALVSGELQQVAGELSANTNDLTRVVEGSKRQPKPEIVAPPQKSKKPVKQIKGVRKAQVLEARAGAGSSKQPQVVRSEQEPKPSQALVPRSSGAKAQANSRSARRGY